MYPTIPYTGRRRIQLHYIRQNGHVCAASRASHIPSILCVLLLVLTATFALTRPAFATDLTAAVDTDSTVGVSTDNVNKISNTAHAADTVSDPAPQPTAPKTLAAAPATINLSRTDLPATQTATDLETYIYIDCPIMGYKGTAYENEPIECDIDDFEDIPERWLYILTPLEAGESYFFTLDLACRTMNAPFEGQITAAYNSYLSNDGSLGTVTITATEQIGPNTFLVYRGELKYIADGVVNLVPNSYGSIYNHHLFYFSLGTTDPDFPEGTEPLGEQRLSRIISPAVTADVALIGIAKCTDNVYDNDLLQSDYMYPHRKYEPAEGPRPNDTLSGTIAAPGKKPVEPSTLSEPIFFLAKYLAPPDLTHPAAI